MIESLPHSIQRVVNELESKTFIDNTILAKVISQIEFLQDDFIPYQTYDHQSQESYGRNLLIDKGKFKILLMSWRVGDFTAIHNHGFTEWGIVHFFGEATHRLYEKKDNTLSLQQTANFKAGQTASVCGDLTHLMGNSGSQDFTTLHIYGSNNHIKNISQNTEVYVPERKKKVLTLGSAYINMNHNLKLSEVKFNNFNPETLIDYFNLVLPFYTRNNQIEIINKIKKYIKKPESFYEEAK